MLWWWLAFSREPFSLPAAYARERDEPDGEGPPPKKKYELPDDVKAAIARFAADEAKRAASKEQDEASRKATEEADTERLRGTTQPKKE